MFKNFSDQVNANFVRLSEDNQVKVFSTDVETDALFQKYMDSFPAEYNGIFRVKEHYNCNSCRSFIKRVGGLLFVKGTEIFTVWDNINCSTPYYKEVADAMREFVLSLPIKSLFLTSKNLKTISVPRTVDNYDSSIIWHHFSAVIPNRLIVREPGTEMGNYNSKVGVVRRGLLEITDSAIELVLDLIDQNQLYRGAENKDKILGLQNLRAQYKVAENKDLFPWLHVHTKGSLIKNDLIGELLMDISEGKDLEESVRLFESRADSSNYQRSTPIITAKMTENMIKRADELGIRSALQRRHAKLSDITINNVLFADSNAIPLMKDPLKDMLMTQVKNTAKPSATGEVVTIEEFLANVLPTTKVVEVLFECKHTNKLTTLIAPEDPEAKNILKWNNNFSWSYNGNITDSSIKQRVKAAGGDTNKDFRVSLSWFNFDDLDIHCHTPQGEIYYRNKMGVLDVDMNAGSGNTRNAVENLAWNLGQIVPNKTYTVVVNNFARRESIDVGFDIEVEYEGQIITYNYRKPVGNKEDVHILDFRLVNGRIEIINENKELSKNGNMISKVEWNISTNVFHKVNAIMLSPNYWDDNAVGNKHYFFMINDCKSDLGMRGLYNEFLMSELHADRKVFEVLGDQLKCKDSDEQLSGLGFSSTIPEELKVKVTNDSGTRSYVVKF